MKLHKIGMITALTMALCACGGGGSESIAPSSPGISSSGGAVDGRSPEGGSSGSSSGPIFSSSASSSSSSTTTSTSSSSSSSSSGIIPQAGLLTAGDYDDVLNFTLYQDYISDFLQGYSSGVEIPYVDVGTKVEVQVTDADGSPMFGATVAVQSEQETLLSLKTTAGGRVNFYPVYDELPNTFQLHVTSSDGVGEMYQDVDLTDLGSDGIVKVLMPNVDEPPLQIDVALVIDTTGSMADEIRYLQAELTEVFKGLKTTYSQMSLNTGLVAYRDIGDVYVTESFPFTDDLTQFEMDLNSLSAGGGGDYPEAMDKALEESMKLLWRDKSVKILLLVADAPPHDNKITPTWASVDTARSEQIHIVPVAASGVASTAEFLMRSAAAITNSRYIFLTDDSGVGNGHAEPTIDCYVVTRLDSSIRRVIQSLVTGVRSEPSEEEIIRTVGIYNEGVCEAPETGPEVDPEVEPETDPQIQPIEA